MEDHDLVALALEGSGNVRPDEAAAANQQDAHGGMLPRGAGVDARDTFQQYIAMKYIKSRMLDRELKKGSAELLILSLVEDQPRHGYDLSKLIEARSGGVLKFRVASLYPLLYRLEKRGWIQGRWIEKAGQRRRRYYRLTTAGAGVLASQRHTWREFVEAINRIAGVEHA